MRLTINFEEGYHGATIAEEGENPFVRARLNLSPAGWGWEYFLKSSSGLARGHRGYHSCPQEALGKALTEALQNISRGL